MATMSGSSTNQYKVNAYQVKHWHTKKDNFIYMVWDFD